MRLVTRALWVQTLAATVAWNSGRALSLGGIGPALFGELRGGFIHSATPTSFAHSISAGILTSGGHFLSANLLTCDSSA